MTFDAMQTITCDVLVIGAGGAGARAAIETAKTGKSCVLICKEQLGRAHTGMAEGGLNVTNSTHGTPSRTHLSLQHTVGKHFHDTLAGGGGINNQRLVQTFTQEALDRVTDLERYGVLFDRTDDGRLAQRSSGKQTYPMTAFIGDYTGREIITALTDQVRRLNISVLEEHFVCELLLADGRVAGALVLDLLSGTLIHCRARAVVLATGGGGRMYRVTTNAASNTGDGYALGLAAGCELVDMEMVQFHPTGMVHPESWRGLLVTESVRGEGGWLFNSERERFMKRYQPEHLELAGRDEVARAIVNEVRAGRGSPHGGVFLSVEHLGAAHIEERLPGMLHQFLATGVDIRHEPCEVYPSMHHIMGGLRIDEDGQTSVAGLFACGEVAGGVHGANRLGGNALAECQVFGQRSGRMAVRYADSHEVAATEEAVAEAATRTRRLLTPRPDGVRPFHIETELREMMWNLVGIERDAGGLQAARAAIRRLRDDAKHMAPASAMPVANADWLACLEVRNMLPVAEAIIESALVRQESRGAHYRTDYPESNERWNCNVVVQRLDGVQVTSIVPLTTVE